MRILNDERLNALPFLAYLKKMKDYVGEITEYQEARDFSRHLIGRYITEYNLTWQNYNQDHEGSMLYNDHDILDKHGMSKSIKGKKAVIEEFKDNINDDLFDMIMSRDNE